MAGDLLHDGDGTFSGELDGPGWERTPWHATQRAAWEGAEECEMNRDGATISSRVARHSNALRGWPRWSPTPRARQVGDVHVVSDRRCSLAILGPAIGCQSDSRRPSPARGFKTAHLLNERVTVLAGHFDVGDDDVRPPLFDNLQGLGRRSACAQLGTGIGQNGGDEIKAVSVVIAREQPKPHKRWRREAFDVEPWPPTFPARVPLSIDDRPGNRDRQAHRKRRPFSLAGTLSTDASSMRFNQMANKSESETEPRVAGARAAERDPARGVVQLTLRETTPREKAQEGKAGTTSVTWDAVARASPCSLRSVIA
jgi:hypothetical protein